MSTPDMITADAVYEVETMSDAEVLRWVDSQVVCTRGENMSMEQYRDWAVELLEEYWRDRRN